MRVLCFICDMVARCIQVLVFLYHVSFILHTSTVPFLVLAAEALINPDLYFSADILWLPLLVYPSTYTTSSQLVRYDTLYLLHHGTCVTFTGLPDSKPKGSGLQYHLQVRNLIWCDLRLQKCSEGYVADVS